MSNKDDQKKQDPLAKLMQQKAALEAKIKRQKAKLAGDERKRDTRRKVLVGATVLNLAKNDPALNERINAELEKTLKRNDERELFDLPPLEAANDDRAGDSSGVSAAS